MTSRERILAAIEHKEVDEQPVMIWLEPHTTLKMMHKIKKPQKKFYHYLGLRLLNMLGNLFAPEDIYNAIPLITHLIQPHYIIELASDAVELSPLSAYIPFKHDSIKFKDGSIRIKDIYGIERGMCGLYMEQVDTPFKTKKDLDEYKFPNFSSPVYYEGIKKFRREYPDVAIACWVSGVQDSTCQWHTMEKFFTGLYYYPKTIKKFLNKFVDHTIPIIKGALKAGADIIIIGDDYGSQNSLLISKEMWEEFTYPCLKKQIEAIHTYGGKALLHSDGYVMPLLDKFIEAELDALHPLQPTAGNDLKEAKEKYGKKLCFFTGIDTQRLPLMRRKEIEEDIIRNYKIASKGSGFVLCTTHNLQVNTPTENIKTMLVTIDKIKKESKK